MDVKTRTKEFHTRTLDIKETFDKDPKDFYISVRLYPKKKKGYFLGWDSKEDIININRIENNGFIDNYVLFDNELRNMENLINK